MTTIDPIDHFLTDEKHPPYSERDNVKLARAQRDSRDGWLVTDADGREIAFVKDGTHWWVLPGGFQ